MSAALIAALEDLRATLSDEGLRKAEESIREIEPLLTHAECRGAARLYAISKAQALVCIALKHARRDQNTAHDVLSALHSVAVR